MKEKIWLDFVHTKFGDEYLCRYISRQREIRKWFKVATILLSGGGIFSAFQDLKIPTIISLVSIALVQLATMIETEIIHSETHIDELGTLRMLYYDRANDLESLFLSYDNLGEEKAKDEFFKMRRSAKEIESLDNKLNIKDIKVLKLEAEIATKKYINTYHNG